MNQHFQIPIQSRNSGNKSHLVDAIEIPIYFNAVKYNLTKSTTSLPSGQQCQQLHMLQGDMPAFVQSFGCDIRSYASRSSAPVCSSCSSSSFSHFPILCTVCSV